MRTATAVALEVAFAILAFGVRGYIQWRRTGSTGFIVPRLNAPPLERLGALLFILALVGLGVAPAAGIEVDLLAGSAWGGIGAVLAVAGIVLCLVAQLVMGDSWRVGVDESETTDLVTEGLFAHVRNPIFTSMLVAAVGFALLVPNQWSIGAVVSLFAGLELQVRYVEEPYLARSHGPAYARYSRQAGRFLPGVGNAGGAG
jgi:protein-S-isoprenylcysteine O-methyltransferase Ste14